MVKSPSRLWLFGKKIYPKVCSELWNNLNSQSCTVDTCGIQVGEVFSVLLPLHGEGRGQLDVGYALWQDHPDGATFLSIEWNWHGYRISAYNCISFWIVPTEWVRKYAYIFITNAIKKLAHNSGSVKTNYFSALVFFRKTKLLFVKIILTVFLFPPFVPMSYHIFIVMIHSLRNGVSPKWCAIINSFVKTFRDLPIKVRNTGITQRNIL